MAPAKLNIHIPPDANPTNVTQLVLLLDKENIEFESVRELLEFADSQGVGGRTEMQTTAVEMGLLAKDRDRIHASQLGHTFSQLREDVRADILHLLLYTGWNVNKPLDFLPSWAYRDSCNRYWSQGEVVLTNSYLDRQVEETINLARETFLAMKIDDFDELAFSRKSLTGARKWLDALQPSVIEDNTFTRRAFCPPELLILAIGYVLRNDPDTTEIDILLSRDRREQICRVCLLDPDSLDRTLDWALSVFPSVIEQGTSAGTYGRFIRLHKMPTLQDIVR